VSPERERERGRTRPRTREAGPAPSRAALHEAALAYLGRGAATADSVKKTLERRIANWSRRAARDGKDREIVEADVKTAREAIDAIVARLREVGLVNDAAFAESRARRLSEGGRSRRAIAAHLAAKGVDEATVREVTPRDASADLDAALVFARKRRVGPFAREEEDRTARQRALGAMARAGFDFDVCKRALEMDREDAETRLRDRHVF